MNDVKEFASPRGTAGARRLHCRRPAVDRRPHPGSSRQRPLDTRHLGRGIRAALRRLSRRQARCRCELRHFSTRDHFPRFGRRGPRRARSGQLQLRYSSCRRSCRRTSGAHWYRGGDAGHGARGSRALHYAKHCGVPMVASELAGSALFVVASSQRETERPVRASVDTIRA